ncbi:dihydrofolate synthase / folylpolyglutamate synthase [Pseudooceanicola antarcticus]|uniref:Dihydrofolate synthase/folylpolyglutamate synthase n=1 Tax=Pseudooceanicola antarcticus TaxID=1247613 RepID=A0A285HMD0_9RHOB|nr:folylpolyglutamate synthase/dihydrofolate synthase family protein [Pseudooceanicola antarcticus]PJE27930.1 bifunctional folylpolyglutamate synthase/dihydrofolate synthase [Pseudooceanicola antarcticus]SNY35841.1 dihydrofolate synthase / folylpolyglutamate synthase [Pseudooceanicola antarcticus]
MTQTGSDALLARMMQLHPKVIDLSLDRIRTLLGQLGHPEASLPPVIHLAGTNGKGSTLAMLRAGIEGAGQSIHAYTSPHLVSFHERIRLSGKLISEEALTSLLQEVLDTNAGEPITFFEITNAAAFLAYARQPADYVLLETGLGGIYDSTNVVDQPAMTIITPISKDHEGFLGDTLAKIAWSKAGIIKRGVPCVVGPQPEEALEVIEETANRLGAPLLVYGQHWHVSEERGRLVFQDENGLLDLPLPALRGPHQIQNAGAALAALRALGFDDTACEAAMTDAEWPARLQRLTEGRLARLAPEAELWLDGGHNPSAGEALAEFLGSLPERPTHLICGMINTKDAGGYLRPLAPHAASLTTLTIPDEPAAVTAAELAAKAYESGHETHEGSSVEEALAAIVAKEPAARILFCGSLYFAGHVLRRDDEALSAQG